MSTCALCKHWRCGEMLRRAILQYADDPKKDDGDWGGECPVLLEVLQIEESVDLYDSRDGGIDSIETPWDFGCNKWEAK